MNRLETARLNRERLQRHIEESPGRHFGEISRHLGLSVRQMRYAVSVLLVEKKIFSEDDGYFTHYYPMSMRKKRKPVSLSTTSREVAEMIEEKPGVCARELAGMRGCARQGVFYHIGKLLALKIIRRVEGDGRRYHYYRTKRKYL